jgi:hypothetical protein
MDQLYRWLNPCLEYSTERTGMAIIKIHCKDNDEFLRIVKMKVLL